MVPRAEGISSGDVKSGNAATSLRAFVQKVRELELFKRPGVAETLDWTRALMALDRHTLDRGTVHRTLGVLLKYQDDLARMEDGGVDEVMDALECRRRLGATTDATR